jgi:hypothetical protein
MALPKTVSASNQVLQTHVANIQLKQGDIILSAKAPQGYHVVLKDHISPATSYPPFQSNDLVHWAVQ